LTVADRVFRDGVIGVRRPPWGSVNRSTSVGGQLDPGSAAMTEEERWRRWEKEMRRR
jgi:hypothetical protein